MHLVSRNAPQVYFDCPEVFSCFPIKKIDFTESHKFLSGLFDFSFFVWFLFFGFSDSCADEFISGHNISEYVLSFFEANF